MEPGLLCLLVPQTRSGAELPGLRDPNIAGPVLASRAFRQPDQYIRPLTQQSTPLSERLSNQICRRQLCICSEGNCRSLALLKHSSSTDSYYCMFVTASGAPSASWLRAGRSTNLRHIQTGHRTAFITSRQVSLLHQHRYAVCNSAQFTHSRRPPWQPIT